MHTKLCPSALWALFVLILAGVCGHSANAQDGLPVLPPGADAARTILLRCGTVAPGAPAGLVSVAPGKVEINGEETKKLAPGGVVVPHPGFSSSGVSFLYTLPGEVSGLYEVWTAFNLGGVATQEFELAVGNGEAAPQPRLAWKQSNEVSWKLAWRKAEGRVRLFPVDKQVRVSNIGRASGKKQLVALALVKVGELPAGMSQTNAALRAQLETWKPAVVQRRVFVLDGKEAAPTMPFLAALARQEPQRSGVQVNFLDGKAAQDWAAQCGVPSLPALAVTDDRFTLLAACDAQASGAQIEAALTASAPLLVRGTADAVPGVPVPPVQWSAAGAPQAWTVAGTWAGKAGLSLWGLGTEAITRPAPGDPCAVIQFDRDQPTTWRQEKINAGEEVVLNPSTTDLVWSSGTAYACLYLTSPRPQTVNLSLRHNGVRTVGWLDEKPLAIVPVKTGEGRGGGDKDVTLESLNDQGGQVQVAIEQAETSVTTRLQLRAGTQRLLLKFIGQHKAGAQFSFVARFANESGKVPSDVGLELADPLTVGELRAMTNRIQPLVETDAPFNLVTDRGPLGLTVDLRQLANAPHETPLKPLKAKLSLAVSDFSGQEILRKSQPVGFPGKAHFDLGPTPARGYYAVHLRLETENGLLIKAFEPDGFSVVGGTQAQRERKAQKKLATTFYWMTAEKAASQYFPYMERLGIFRNIGGHPGPAAELYQAAHKRGIVLAGDLNQNDSGVWLEETVAAVGPTVDVFKSYNEVDIVPRVRRTPEHWTAVSKAHYQAAKARYPRATVVGGSLVRPGSDNWFRDCLALGLDQWVDAWDVHCYPKVPPVLEGSMSNSPLETELGVLKSYAALGRTNDKPFWIGETGARASHGADARRWQADTVAKMIACAGSRQDFPVIGFLVPWWYSRSNGKMGDIEAGHMPAEAAYYTAGALIDGFPYTRLNLGRDIQAATFGPTTMLWATSGGAAARDVKLKLDAGQKWVCVSVVGQVRPLAVSAGNEASVAVTESPVYILKAADYQNLTR